MVSQIDRVNEAGAGFGAVVNTFLSRAAPQGTPCAEPTSPALEMTLACLVWYSLSN